MYLLDLPAILRRAPGLVVVEHPGWQTRGHGGMTSVDGVVAHHTAGPASGDAPSLGVVVEGRPDLSGPLANLFLSRSGVVTIVAAGLAYHAGQVRATTYTNGRRIGIEAEATGRAGVPSDWPEAQVRAYALTCAALAFGYAFPVREVLGHREVCFPVGRKIDPYPLSMDELRARAARELAVLGRVSRDEDRTPAVPPAGERPVLALGARGAAVRALQARLDALGFRPGPVDGVFGTTTELAVVGLQCAAGLLPDGVVGPRTDRALDAGTRPRIVLSRPLGPGARGDVVRTLQRELLRVGAKLPRWGADGSFGDETRDAVKWVQGRAGETRDGIVGERTVPRVGGAWAGAR